MMVRLSRIWKLYPVDGIVLFAIIRARGIGRVKIQDGGVGLWRGTPGRVSSDVPGWP